MFYFDVRLPVCISADEAAGILAADAREIGCVPRIIKFSPGYFVSADHPMVALLTDLYNRETNSDGKPYVMGACTYARLFEQGCGFGGGCPTEVKPFPAGHGAAHGPDEAHNIDVLMTAIKMYILGILAIDEAWN